MSWELTKACEFAEHSTRWDQLNHDTYQSPILEARFVAPLITHFGNGSEWICTYKDNGKIVAMGIIKKKSFGNWSTFQPSQAPIGLWLCDSHYNLTKLLASLTSKIPGPCAIFSLLQQDCQLTPRADNESRITTLDYIQTAKIHTNIGYEAYNKSRSKNLRKNLRKQHNKLLEKSLETSLQVIRNADQVQLSIREYGELESGGWKSKTNTAIHPDNTQGKYYTQILKNFCESSDAIIYKYLIGDQLAAMDLCVCNNDTIVILKTTYNESLGEYSPALLMHNEVFQDIFENTSFQSIEFYGKVMDWHKKWSNDFRDIYHLNFYTLGVLKMIHSKRRES